jgi:hypothetical protein
MIQRRFVRLRRASVWAMAWVIGHASGVAFAGQQPAQPQVASQAAHAVQAASAPRISVVHEEGVEIITSHATPVAARPTASAAPEVSTDPAGTGEAPVVHGASTINATLSGPRGAFPDDIRGDHRLRANLLNADGTPNEEADNSAHRMVNARRAQVQADLKMALKAFDDAKRDGTNRNQLNQWQARIRTDLDEIDMLTRSQQSGSSIK